MKQIYLLDETIRDAHQSNWATRMTNAMIAPIASRIDQAGYITVDLAGGAVFDVCVRYLKENPWERMRIFSKVFRNTPLQIWNRGQSLFTFELFPDDIVALTTKNIAACGIKHLHVYDALNDIRNIELPVKTAKEAGLSVTADIVYSLSPVHTDAHYQDRAREIVQLKVDRICIKDPSGLLTPERTRTLVPAVKEVIGEIPLEIHTHCIAGGEVANQVYVEAMERGATIFHTAVRPLAYGAAQPPAEYVIEQALQRGFAVDVDSKVLEEIAGYFTWVAYRENKPLGEPQKYNPKLYEHQLPGGMITNFKSQLKDINMEHRLEEILEEVAQVRKDFGYPVSVSPFSQMLFTQATLNVVQGERYKTIPIELQKLALGYYGKTPGPVAQEILDRVVTGNRTPVTGRAGDYIPPAIERLRAERGPFASDDELLLKAYYYNYDPKILGDLFNEKGEAVSGLRFRTSPLIELVEYLSRKKDIHKVQISFGGLELRIAH